MSKQMNELVAELKEAGDSRAITIPVTIVSERCLTSAAANATSANGSRSSIEKQEVVRPWTSTITLLLRRAIF